MFRTFIRAIVAAILLMQAAGVRATESSFYAARRQAVMSKIEDSVALLQGAEETRAYVSFRQNNDFYYLTGVEVPGAFLLIDAPRRRSILFLPPRDRRSELWEGGRLYPGDEARTITGCDEVLEVSTLEAELEKRKTALKTIYTPMAAEETAATSRDRASTFDHTRETNPWDGRVSKTRAFAQSLKRKLGESVSIKDLSAILDDMRRVKDAHEIELMRESARIGAMGLTEAVRATKPGLFEYQIASVAEFIFRWNGAMGPAYFPIVGSGPNSCTLHYHNNSRRMEPGDIVVVDFGPDYRYYHSDITRTFPVSGKFTEEQARVYQIVLDAQRAALQKVRPGATVADIGGAARNVVARFDYIKYWQHGVSHYVGMSTHDVGDLRPLEPGVVLTIEPGVYIPEKRLGVRIEDTVLVTREGCEVLSKDVPKEIIHIERLMSEKSVYAPK